MTPRSLPTPMTWTSWPFWRRVWTTSNSVRQGASRTSFACERSGGTRLSSTRASTRTDFTSGPSQGLAVPPAVQGVHGLDGQEAKELLAGLVLGLAEAKVELAAAADHVRQHLVHDVEVLARPAAHDPPGLAAQALQETGGGHVAGVLRVAREQTPEVAVVELGLVD